MSDRSLKAVVQQFIDQRGISQRRLASMAGIVPSVITDLLNKPRYTPRVDTVRKLATAMGMPLSELLLAAGYTQEEVENIVGQDRLETQLNRRELRLIAEFRQLSPDDQNLIVELSERLTQRPYQNTVSVG